MSEMVERTAAYLAWCERCADRADYTISQFWRPLSNNSKEFWRERASRALGYALDPEDEATVLLVARGMLPVLCPSYENTPGDVFDPTLEVFTYQRTLCLGAARCAIAALKAAAQGET